jgi:hypothetical protein
VSPRNSCSSSIFLGLSATTLLSSFDASSTTRLRAGRSDASHREKASDSFYKQSDRTRAASAQRRGGGTCRFGLFLRSKMAVLKSLPPTFFGVSAAGAGNASEGPASAIFFFISSRGPRGEKC